jgi:hypothetical protein
LPGAVEVVDAHVRCFNAAGALIDTRYTVLVFGPKAGPTSVALAN